MPLQFIPPPINTKQLTLMDPEKNGYFEPTDNASKSMLPATLLGAR